MKKHLVFMHQNYPAQFGPIVPFLLQNYDVNISFFSEYVTKPVYPGVNHRFFRPAVTGHEKTPYFFSRHFESECASMHGVYDAIQAAKLDDPDIFVGHVAFGNMGLLHVEYPEAERIGFFELFYDPFGRISDNRKEYPTQRPNQIRVPLRNATQLVELEYCTKGYSPTPFQRSTYPEAYQHKLEVIFDGIDTQLYQPGAVSEKSELPVTWPRDARIVTYVSRGLEAMRGFDIFMEVAHKVSQKLPDVHFVVAGNPRTHYGSELMAIQEPTFKEHVLKKQSFDLNRFHFLNWISEPALVDLYRLSQCHFYWTVPFTLSWSLFQAMSTGCLILASDSTPVRDIVFHEQTGLLASPYDIDGMVERMIDMLENQAKYAHLCENARQLMTENYDFDICLPKLAEFYLSGTSAIETPPSDKVPALA